MGKEAQAASVNVADDQALGRAFQQHLDKFQSLDIVCLNAGVLEKGNLLLITFCPIQLDVWSTA